MPAQNEDFSIFLQLGMTTQQTKVYIALSKIEKATVRTIAKTAQMDRAEVYRTIPKLRKLGLIKKLITYPTTYRAIPISEGLTTLLQQETERHKQNQAKAKQFLRNFDHNQEEKSQEECKHTLTFGQKAERREFIKDLSGIQISTDGVFNWENFLFVFNKYFEEYRRLLERGVKIRRITNKPEGARTPTFIQTLKENGSFEVRKASIVPKADIDILDKKMIGIVFIPNCNRREMEVLRSKCLGMIEIAQEYFELKWQSATAFASS